VSSFTNVAIGQILVGPGIPPATTITAFDATGGTITMSQPATADGTSVSVSAAGWQGWLQAHMQTAYANPAPMNIISQGQPAYGEGTVVYAPADAVLSDYTYGYRCTAPCALDVDLSAVPVAQRQQAVVAWYADQTEFYADPGGPWSMTYYNEPRDYTIDINTAAGGGSPPTSGWTTLATVTGNVYDARMHPINLAGANWIRMRITATNGSPGNTDALFHFDVLNASAGTSDSWLILGDSTTEEAMTHQEPTNFMQQVNGTESSYYPVEIDGGQGGWEASTWTTTDPTTGNPYIIDALNAYPGHYVALDLGANEANNGDTSSYIPNMTTMINDVIAAGKVPELRYSIDWMCTANGSANGPTINSDLQTLIATYPQAVIGPDEWQFLGAYGPPSASGSLMSADCLHPSIPTGMNDYRQQYVNTLLTDVYGH
jgi:hypothetical protein